MTTSRRTIALGFVPSFRVGCSDEPAEYHSSHDGTEPGETTRNRDAATHPRVNTSAPVESAPTRHVAAMRAIASATLHSGEPR